MCVGISIRHLPLTNGQDLQLGLLLTKYRNLQSLHVRFKALTASSIESLKDFPQLRRLDLSLDSLHHGRDKTVLKSVFALTRLEKLALDVGYHDNIDLADFLWTKLADLHQLTFSANYTATQQQYDFISLLTGLQQLHVSHNCPSVDCLTCLSRLTTLSMHMSVKSQDSLLTGLGLLTRLCSLKIDGTPCHHSVVALTTLTNLTSLGFWPDPYRFGCVSKCCIPDAALFCHLRKLQHLRCAFVDGKKYVSAQLSHKSTYREPMTVADSPITICSNLWKG